MSERLPIQRDSIRALTGVRFLAAFHVVLYHYAQGFIAPPLLGHVVENGYLAVNLFFILSGFVLAYNYSQRVVSAGAFWRARFARIYPAYFSAFLLIAPAVILRLKAQPWKLLACAIATSTLTQGWFPSIALTWNGPGWSLSSEAFFYLLFPLLLPLFAKLSTRGLLGASTFICSVAFMAPVVDIAALGSRFQSVVLCTPIFRLPEFCLGIVTGLIYVRRHRIEFPSALIAVSLTLVAFAAFSRPAPQLLRGPLSAPLFAALVYLLACGRHSRLARFLAWDPIYRLGDASYAVYILQSPLMAYFLYATQGAASAGEARTQQGPVSFLAYSLLLVGLSLACHKYIEEPARKRITSAFARLALARNAALVTAPN